MEKGEQAVRGLTHPSDSSVWNWYFFVSLIHHLTGIGICHTILICVKLVFIFDICSSVTHSIKFAFAKHTECNNFSTVSLFELQISLKGAFE